MERAIERICILYQQEQIELAVEEGVDYIIAETFTTLAEAMLAVEAIKGYGKGVYYTCMLHITLMLEETFHYIFPRYYKRVT